MTEPGPGQDPKWWTDPRGIVSAVTVVSMILGFFYVRERQMWEQSARIATLEARGLEAITRAGDRFVKLEEWVSSIRDQVNFLERKISILETKEYERDGRRQKSYESAPN